MTKLEHHVNPEYLKLIEKIVAQYKELTYKQMQIEKGHKVLDVGCGPGTDTTQLAQFVGKTGQVFGIDNNKEMITEANNRVVDGDNKVRIKHLLNDAAALPFEKNYFDSVRSERLFQHLLNPEKVFLEMVRVTKSGGRIVVLDTDWSTLSIDVSETEIEQRLKNFRLEQCLENATAGRQLFRLFKQNKLNDISIKMCPIYLTDYIIGRQSIMLDKVQQSALSAEIITKYELEKWQKCLEQQNNEGIFFGSVNQVMVAGTKQ
jgi:ubiquinone/menaquinone biosynthesis C-methylase UbiE